MCEGARRRRMELHRLVQCAVPSEYEIEKGDNHRMADRLPLLTIACTVVNGDTLRAFLLVSVMGKPDRNLG
jgi:hypothetical protein